MKAFRVPVRVPKPDPVSDADSAYFWAKCSYGELYGQRCGHCGLWRWPPRRFCPECHEERPVWQKLPGTGTIVGLVVQMRPMDQAFADQIPLAIVHIEMDGTDGAMVFVSRLQAWDFANARVGARVDVVFGSADDDNLPTFTVLPR